MIDKYCADLTQALSVVQSGASIAVGGFGSSGRPDALLNALCDLDLRDLHVIVNNVGDDFTGIGRLVMEGRVRRFTGSFPILQEFYDRYFAGKVELELIPQGTLAERMRAGGSGIAAFYTPSSAGTMLSDGTFPLSYADGQVSDRVPAKEVREFGGRPHVLEHGIVADVALVKAQQGDRKGNLRFHLSARNFNPPAAMCGRITFAEVEELVEVGRLGADDIHLPGVFIDHIGMTAEPIPATAESIAKEGAA
ncbi:CoA transferase subunit A [Microbacterium thalassium]|uniref:3-oxoacid CoA-transferase subunit A n=1 Tax=Microbacterium thalassium TaxID=362649 RepID=A0A7X0KW13_9MICO|nr:3-oxoacid CoA-transferase subunit A [Microbacterium thalassium]MBB6392821.1 3-oxoacid CoA-transferase subunit A [Microbacterium thalassium]GLK22948.1 succinyl-CoA--3-ketoacid-CoA transferase [Microbacterium thalassium]